MDRPADEHSRSGRDGPPPRPPQRAEAGGVEVAPAVRVPADALRFATARSGGPGGQNVNKVETKVELRIDVDVLPLPGWAIARLRSLAGSRIVGATIQTDESGRTHLRGGELVITAQESRSQSRNKAECLERLRELLVQSMVKPKVRRKTKPSRGSVERRLTEKRSRSDTKRRRGGRADQD